ncbi:hypothetical protein G6F32_015023 [Rhizopus arrhizus]|nr:hypothetical protein G6F32_015023 [Rhizopus arrhizus]
MGAGISGAGPSVFAWFEDADQARAAAAPVQAAPAVLNPSPSLDTEPMQFVSTRGQSPAVGLSAAIAAGLAPDGGLYVPALLPAARELQAGPTLADTAAELLAPVCP